MTSRDRSMGLGATPLRLVLLLRLLCVPLATQPRAGDSTPWPIGERRDHGTTLA